MSWWYIYYKSFMDDHGLKNKFSVATTILNNSSRRTTAQEDDFDDGLFKVADKEESEQTIQYINKVLTEIDSSKCKNSFFYYSMLHALSHVGFNRNHFLKKVEKLSAKFKGATNSQEWLDIIEKWAEENDCDSIETYCRKGFIKKLEKFGYSNTYVVLGKELTTIH